MSIYKPGRRTSFSTKVVVQLHLLSLLQNISTWGWSPVFCIALLAASLLQLPWIKMQPTARTHSNLGPKIQLTDSGDSTLGTSQAPILPLFLKANTVSMPARRKIPSLQGFWYTNSPMAFLPAFHRMRLSQRLPTLTVKTHRSRTSLSTTILPSPEATFNPMVLIKAWSWLTGASQGQLSQLIGETPLRLLFIIGSNRLLKRRALSCMKRAPLYTGMVCCRSITRVYWAVPWVLGSMAFLLWASALLPLEVISHTASSQILTGPPGIIRIIAHNTPMDSSERWSFMGTLIFLTCDEFLSDSAQTESDPERWQVLAQRIGLRHRSWSRYNSEMVAFYSHYLRRLHFSQSDWYHNTSESIVAAQEAPFPNNPAGIPIPDNNLINGKNNFDCSLEADPARRVGCISNAGISTFNFTKGKVHRLRLINAGGEALQRFTIDNHNITIVANGKTISKPAQLTDNEYADTICFKTSYPSNLISHYTTWSP